MVTSEGGLSSALPRGVFPSGSARLGRPRLSPAVRAFDPPRGPTPTPLPFVLRRQGEAPAAWPSRGSRISTAATRPRHGFPAITVRPRSLRREPSFVSLARGLGGRTDPRLTRTGPQGWPPSAFSSSLLCLRVLVSVRPPVVPSLIHRPCSLSKPLAKPWPPPRGQRTHLSAFPASRPRGSAEDRSRSTRPLAGRHRG